MTNLAPSGAASALPSAAGADFASDPAVDAQYNAGAAVADSSLYAPRWAAQSAALRQRLGGRLDIAYGPSPAETLDVFPAARARSPVFVFLHGGYWRAFSSKEFSWVAGGLHAAGFTTVVVNYALAPTVTIDEIVRQCRSAVAWTVREIAPHGGDPARIAVGGHSAGGHLTAMCLQADWARDFGLAADPLAAAMLVSGVYDIAPLMRSYLQPQIRLDAGIVARNAPMFSVRPCPTPILVAWGADESAEFHRQSNGFHDAWSQAGNRSELLPLAGADHFSAVDGFASADSAILRWLTRTLAAAA